ncbi:endonuclease/exonuclease/phosphatase family protein [uncultured Bacteroides sp.]|uniref:endonuclease/exonuclease/phosphatase family protein n=1 Tax=uncultured Bacteroides sp. TaxID=162156 RepID=UPI0025E55018|nr:endonuclease/exonuclease/phosphatase family protein [uncultured Bacteroides sp.]
MFLPRNNRQSHRQTESDGNSERRVAITILFFMMAISGAGFIAAQESLYGRDSLFRERISFRIVSWNIENLFDIRHDSLKNDHEFLPDALRHWNYDKYKKKLTDIARVIAAIGEWNPPALIALCEVENDAVLRDLTRRSPLKELNYRYVMTDSPDSRGMDVALLYQRELFKLLSSRSIPVSIPHRHRPTRDLLHVSGLLLTGDTLDVFICHLPSRSGGARETEPYRLHAARMLRAETNGILHKRLHPQVVVMGDFNDYPTDKSVREVLEAEAPTSPLSSLKLYHLLARKAQSRDFGSYKYQGKWGLLDHLIVSGALLNQSGNCFTSEEKANVCRLPFLLTEDTKYGGMEPFRTYKGMKYQGGISDHLPVYADFELILH